MQMKQLMLKTVAMIGEKAAKSAVCASSPWCCYQPKEPEAARRKFLGNKEQDDAKK